MVFGCCVAACVQLVAGLVVSMRLTRWVAIGLAGLAAGDVAG